MTLTKERVEELDEYFATASPGFVLADDEVTIEEFRSLLAAYRTREAAIAECEAWRAWESGEAEASELDSVKVNVEASPAEIEQMWSDFNAEIAVLHNAIKEARAATDAARRLEVNGE